MTKIIRQGDVSLTPVSKTFDGKKITNPVLAFGEVTGTKHMLEAECREWTDDLDRRFLEVLSEGGILVQDGPGSHHAPLVVPPGTYRVSIAREQDFYAGVERQTVD